MHPSKPFLQTKNGPLHPLTSPLALRIARRIAPGKTPQTQHPTLLLNIPILTPNRLIPTPLITPPPNIPMINPRTHPAPDSMTRPILPLTPLTSRHSLALTPPLRHRRTRRHTEQILHYTSLNASGYADAPFAARLHAAVDARLALRGAGALDLALARPFCVAVGGGDVVQVGPAFVAAGVGVRVVAAHVGAAAVCVGGGGAREVAVGVGCAAGGESGVGEGRG